MKEHQNLFRDLQEDFRKMKKNLLVAQSGGPTAAINATLAGVIKQAIKEEQIDQVYGACYGIQGVLEQKFVNLTEKVDTEEKLEKLKRTPAAGDPVYVSGFLQKKTEGYQPGFQRVRQYCGNFPQI